MKKLMILAAVACAAVVSQASAVDWTLTGSGTSQKSKVYYIFDSVDRATIVGLLEAGTTTGTAASILADSAWTSAVKANGALNTTPGAEGAIDLGDGVGSGTAKSYFAVVFNKNATQGADSATKYYISSDAAGKAFTPSTPTDRVVAEMSIVGKSLITIPTAAIPEPTSGLLLLLGVAGLALKRKHA